MGAFAEFERNIIKADLLAREEENPGSTWQDQVEIALQDAKPIGRARRASEAHAGGQASVMTPALRGTVLDPLIRRRLPPEGARRIAKFDAANSLLR